MFGKKKEMPGESPAAPPPAPVKNTVSPSTSDWEMVDGQGRITMRNQHGERHVVMTTRNCSPEFAKELITAACRGIRGEATAPQRNGKEQDVTTPYIGYSNETLAKLPDMKDGETITCPHCWKTHAVEGTGGTYFYQCHDKTYLAGVGGKNVVNVKPDVKGSI